MSFDREKAKKNIETILDKINSSETDILLLKNYHKLFRKEISIFKRSMAAAWLFMYYDKKEAPPAGKSGKLADLQKTTVQKPNSRNTSAANTEEIQTSLTAEITLPEEESKKLFISIGKNRRLFPKEIITLIMSKTSVPREDIGIIKILDNFSFVQVRESKADEIIEALNGVRFRGRTLVVNYAKSRD